MNAAAWLLLAAVAAIAALICLIPPAPSDEDPQP